MESQSQKRNIAIKTSIQEIKEGKYMKEEGWTPNYIITKTKKQIIRANIIGAIINKQEEPQINLIIDDGTGQMILRTFEPTTGLNKFEPGDFVQTIGKPREFGNERYLLIEAIKEINPLWGVVRKLELEKEKLLQQQNPEEFPTDTTVAGSEAIEYDEEIISQGQDITQEIMTYISSNDQGDGVNIEEILLKIKQDGLKNTEKIIKNLLEEGEIFEVRPGRVKVL